MSDEKKAVPPQLVANAFKPGQSGNPGGRPKGYERRIRDVIDAMTADDPVPDPANPNAKIPAFEAIVKRAVLDAVAGDKYARDFIADRLMGKPKQHVDLKPVARTKADLSGLTPAQKRAHLQAYEALRDLGVTSSPTDEDDRPPTEH